MEVWTFAYAADMQPGSPKSYRYNPSWIENWREARKQLIELNPELLLVGGDVTRDGSIHRYELEEMKRELEFPFPVHVIPGNMDTGNKHTRIEGRHRGPDQCTDTDLNVTSDQLRQFASVFGPSWWSFVHRNVRFSGFADTIVNSGLPEEAEFWRWADQVRELPREKHHVWIMHYPLFVESVHEPNWAIDDPVDYRNWYFSIDEPGRGRLFDLFKATGTKIVISGHVHCHRVVYEDGIRFEIAPATSFGQWKDRWPDGDASLGFLRYDVGDDDIECTFVPLARSHELEGYGPGGHPAPHARDYSQAREEGGTP
jgi:hypothetical protein